MVNGLEYLSRPSNSKNESFKRLGRPEASKLP